MHKDFLHWGFYILKGNTCENILGKLCTIIKVYKAYGKKWSEVWECKYLCCVAEIRSRAKSWCVLVF